MDKPNRKKKSVLKWEGVAAVKIEASLFSAYNSDWIKQVYINHSNNPSIPANAFSELRNLKTLYLDENEIEAVNELTFAGLVSLKELSISFNKIKSIPGNTFVELRNLEQLYLTGNRIETLDERAFSGLVSLTTLDISDNKIKSIPSNALSELKSVRLMWLDDSVIKRKLFAGLDSLKEVNGRSPNSLRYIFK
jgi:Leucine-rich repeat (LRR) protein